MDVMLRDIYRNQEAIDFENKRNQWSVFLNASEGKKLYLFGAGMQALYFREKYGQDFVIHGVFDNNKSLHGSIQYGIEILNPERIADFSQDEDIIIITNTYYYKEIGKQMDDMGFHNHFSLLEMEAQREEIRNKLLQYRVQPELFEKECADYGQDWMSVQQRTRLKACWKENIQPWKVIVFSNHYSDHAKYIVNYLKDQEHPWDFVWVSPGNDGFPSYIRWVHAKDIDAVMHEMATAKIWLTTMNFPTFAEKRAGQYAIYLKHWSSITLKKFSYDTPGLMFKDRELEKHWFQRESKVYDYVFVGSEFDKRTCSSGLCYDGKFVNVGSPRTDLLFQKMKQSKRIYQELGLSSDEKYILYAPTFRWKGTNGSVKASYTEALPDFAHLNCVMGKKFGGKWKTLLRFHPFIADNIKSMFQDDPEVMDVGKYPDIQDLLTISDVVISDYSSLVFEPAMVGTKVFLYAPDYQTYLEKERELWFSLEELPFATSETLEALYQSIVDFDEAAYIKDTVDFFQKHGVKEDGCASACAGEAIILLIEEDEIKDIM